MLKGIEALEREHAGRPSSLVEVATKKS